MALTAHTTPADRNRSLESGVDEFVSKPYTLHTLRHVLRRWIGEQTVAPAPEPAPARLPTPTASQSDGLLNEARFEQILELDRLNGGGLLARLVQSFREATPTTLDQLRRAIGDGDAEGVARAAHELKSANFNLAAESMAVLSRELESLGRSGTTDGAAALIDRLDELFPAVQAELEARLSKLETPSEKDDIVSA